MHAISSDPESIDRKIDIRLTPRSLAPRVLSALNALGYVLRDEIDAPKGSRSASGFWLVDEARLGEVPSPEDSPDARILLLSSPRQTRHADRRIRAQTPRPARLSDVYSMIQCAIEHTPRKTPRIRTQLSARCIRAERRSIGAVLSLSEGGCLLRTGDPLRKGARVNLQFALPEYGLVSAEADCRYTRRGDVGLEFAAPPPDIRHSIAHFVTLQLATTASHPGA